MKYVKIHNLKELNKLNRTFKYGDEVFFTAKSDTIKYYIAHESLIIMGGSANNAMIFDYLDLNVHDKYKLAERCYGYRLPDVREFASNWPGCKYNDNPALERLIREIYKILGDNSVKVNKEELITNRFKILDL